MEFGLLAGEKKVFVIMRSRRRTMGAELSSDLLCSCFSPDPFLA